MLYAVIAAFAFSISDELHQVFVPGRSADIFDLIADFAGILVLTYLYKYLLKKYKALNI
jgi:VanZ family protein